MKQKTFRFAERSKQKELSRAHDEARLKSGEVAPSDLRNENAFVKGAGFAKKKVGFSPKCRPENGDKYFMVEPVEVERVLPSKSEAPDEAE